MFHARVGLPGISAAIAAIAGVAFLGCARLEEAGDGVGGLPGSSPPETARPADARSALVTRVVDGDTVHLEGLGSSRLIGIDTPEVHESRECFGPEAARFTRRTLAPGRRVRVLPGSEPVDRYGRNLVYLWLVDGRLFNEVLAQRGYARPLTIPPNDRFADALEGQAAEAEAEARGLWRQCGSAE